VRRVTLLVAALALALVGSLAALLLPEAARATVAPPGPLLDIDAPTPLFDLSELAPGGGGDATVVVTNHAPRARTVEVRIVDLVDDDNGCNRPESADGDTSCGPGGGELGRDLLVSATADDDGPLTGRTIRDVADAADPWLAVAVPAGGRRTVRLHYELPASSPNDTQTDRVDFGVEIGTSLGPAFQLAATSTERRTIDGSWAAASCLLTALVAAGLVTRRRRPASPRRARR
jgi:hypothetical protein